MVDTSYRSWGKRQLKVTTWLERRNDLGGFLWGIIPTKVFFFCMPRLPRCPRELVNFIKKNGNSSNLESWWTEAKCQLLQKKQQKLWFQFQSCKTTNSMGNDQIFGRTSVSLFNSEVFRFESFWIIADLAQFAEVWAIADIGGWPWTQPQNGMAIFNHKKIKIHGWWIPFFRDGWP
jgi:hypothetical protein